MSASQPGQVGQLRKDNFSAFDIDIRELAKSSEVGGVSELIRHIRTQDRSTGVSGKCC